MFRKNRNLLIIALIALVNMLGYGIIIPIIYSYSKHYGLTDFQNGLLFALFSICQFISTPIIGRLSDKYGRRPLLLVSIIGTLVSFLMMAFAPSALFVFLARALDGLTAGNIPVAFAVISDTTEPKDRARAFGLIGAAFSFGFIFGPAISAITVGYSEALPFLIAAGITGIAALMTALFLPETNKHMGEVKKAKLFDLSKLWHTLFDPNVGATFMISLVFYLAFSCAIIFGFQPFAINVLKITTSQNALIFTMFGVIGLLAQTLLVGRFTKFFGMKKAFTISLYFITFAFVVMFFSHAIGLFLIAAAILSIANSIAQTLITTILSQETDAKSQGTMLGLNASYQSIGMIVGPIVGGLIATIAIPWTFLAGAALMTICIALSHNILRPGIRKESAF